MTARAPGFRSVCQLTGDIKPPTKFFEALAAADRLLAEVEELRGSEHEECAS